MGRKSNDTQDGLREALALLEKEFDAISTALMGTEEFAKAAGAISTIQIRLQKVLEGHMARQLERFNMPSRDDILALGERMTDVDERLIQIEEKLRRIDPQQAIANTNQPPRTKKPAAKSTTPAPSSKPATPKPDFQK